MIAAANTLELIVTGLFDYAGMFPPENKSFTEALYASARFPGSLKRPHLTGADLVLPFARLSDLTGDNVYSAGFESDKTLSVAVLGSPIGSSGRVSAAAMDKELKIISRYQGGGTDDLVPLNIISYEVKLPPECAAAFIESEIFSEQIDAAGRQGVTVFIEPEMNAEKITPAAADLCKKIAGFNGAAGLKVRGSGPLAIDNRALAKVIEAVCRAEIRLKATAGLHHPLIESVKYGNTLGFMGLTVALYLRRALGESFTEEEILKCLTCTDAPGFIFGDKLSWGGKSVSLTELAAIKERFPFSIGSCSLSEPDSDILRLFGPLVDAGGVSR